MCNINFPNQIQTLIIIIQDLAEYACEASSKEKEDPELQIYTEGCQPLRLRVEGTIIIILLLYI